jgi:hypothetical protein
MSTMFTIAPFDSRSRDAAGLREEERGAQVGADEVLPLALGNLSERCRVERGGVVHEPVEATERARGIVNELRERGKIEEIGLHDGRRARAGAVQVGSQAFGLVARPVAMEHHARAGCVQRARDRRADTPRRARDEDSPFPLHAIFARTHGERFRSL